MSQSSLWQIHTQTGDFAELCNGLYQRETAAIAKGSFVSAQAVQLRIASLPYYINRTAHAMMEVVAQGYSPLLLDTQNASWSAKQSKKSPWTDQFAERHVSGDNEQGNDAEYAKTVRWYLQADIAPGLVVPVLLADHIIIDCIDRVDVQQNRIRTNVAGWFSLTRDAYLNDGQMGCKRLLKPNKKIMISACAGHCWQGNSKQLPIIPTLRELLLSCSINWKNFKKPLVI